MEQLMCDLASFGAAGIMGAMWLWERRLSRERDTHLRQAHERIMRDEERLDKLTEVVEQNTAAIVRFSEIQRTQNQILMRWIDRQGVAAHASE